MNAPIRTSTDPVRCEIAGGKGRTTEQAIASCLGEAFERYALASTDRRKVVIGTASEVDGAIDVATTFGFPVVDRHPSISPLDHETVLEWLNGTDVSTGDPVRIPANFAFCPYSSSQYPSIVAGSTNGAASGANLDDARSQALREIVERDAFWFYARTGVEPIHVDSATLPVELREAMSRYNGVFAVTLLPNPFRAPVANVAFTAQTGFEARSARGSGHAATVEASLWRAFVECIQMLFSLDSGIDVEPTDTDMRNLWFSGRAAVAMPNLFTAVGEKTPLERARQSFTERLSADDLVVSATIQQLAVFEMPLATDRDFAVTKVLMSGASVSDATYFTSCDRLAYFASVMALPEPSVRYRGSLFR